MRRADVMMSIVAVIVMLAGWPSRDVAAQDMGLAERRPRFLYAASQGATPVQIDASRSGVLRRVIALRVEHPTIGKLLAAIERQTGLTFAYDDRFPLDRAITLRADSITVMAALSGILLDTGVDVVLSRTARVSLVKASSIVIPVQVGSLVGRVTDVKTGNPIIGADVWLEGTGHRATTGEKGFYKLADVEAGKYTLAVRRVGYTKQSRSVAVATAEELTVDVALEPAVTKLDEIVTTVTGEQRILELGHVVGRINADSLVKEAPVTNISELLTGRVPGLQVFQAQGTVGGQVRLQVRGVNSLQLKSEPMVIVDGVRYKTDPAQPALYIGPTMESTSPLNDLNPNDIASVEIVKGPSAATLYGTDAANGVIVITTKRGVAGPAKWNVYVKGGVNDMAVQRYPESYWGWGRRVSDNAQRRCVLAQIASGGCVQDSVTVIPNPLNDSHLTLFGNEPRREAGLNVSGGGQGLRYYISGGIEQATGAIRLPDYAVEQLKAQRGVTELPEEIRKPNTLDKVNLRASTAAGLGERAELRINSGYIRNATRSIATYFNPYRYGTFEVGSATDPYGPGSSRPEQAFAQTSTEFTDRFVGTAGTDWRPASWLTARATAGLDLGTRNRKSLTPPGVVIRNDGYVAEDRVRQVATTADLGVTATLRHGRLTSRTSVGAQYQRNLNDGISSAGVGLPPGGTSVGEAAEMYTGQAYSETATLGSYLEEMIGLNDRLFLTGALRVDGASAFGQNYNAIAYPKVQASWLVSEEPFLPRISGLDELRLRYAYGASGQQPQPAWSRPTFTPTRSISNGNVGTVITLTRLGNPDLRPERVREHEFGVDATGLGGKVQIELTWYKRQTIDQIASLALPNGFGSMFTNLGRTAQHGFEAQVVAHLLDTRRLSWDLTLQHALHRTKLVDIGGAREWKSLFGGYVEGYPLGARFDTPILGYEDINGDGIIVTGDIQFGANPVFVGEGSPPQTQTMTSMVGLFDRRLRISALLERKSGFTQVDDLRTQLCSVNRCRELVDRTTPLAEQVLPRAVASFSTSFLTPGDYTRLREVAMAVDLPTSWARVLRVRSATLNVAGRNLALWTDFGGPDPESGSASGGSTGVSNLRADGIPQGRTWMLRLDLGL